MTAPEEIRNLCVNPLLKTSDLTVETGCTLSYTDSGNTLHVISTGDSAGRVRLPPIDITPYYGRNMVMSVETVGSGTVADAALCYVRFNNSTLALSGPPNYGHGAAWPFTRITWAFNCLDKTSGATTLTPVLTSMAGSGNSALRAAHSLHAGRLHETPNHWTQLFRLVDTTRIRRII